jgi:hypothetical protein
MVGESRRGIYDVEQLNYWMATGAWQGGKVRAYMPPTAERKFLIGNGEYCMPTKDFVKLLKSGKFGENVKEGF